MKKALICIVCPNGCQLEVDFEQQGSVRVNEVAGHLCDKGADWAEQEMTHPVRTIAGNVLVEGGDFPLVSVKTDSAVPLEKIADVMKDIKAVRVRAPVRIGQVLVEHPAGTECRIVATRHVNRTAGPSSS
mgnify:CR=1 FL=1